MLPQADKNNIRTGLQTLAQFDSAPEQAGTTRVLFSDEENEARSYIKDLMQQTGMTVQEDAIGNIFGTLAGNDPDAAPVWSGSHIDTVINAGMYDGMAGVIGAIEACRMIRASGEAHQRPITVVVFASEEPTRFGTGCIGSRAMAGHLSLEQTKELYDDNGISLYSELERLGYTKLDYNAVRKHKGDVFASVELHIEQAPVLEQLGIPIGLVTGICAPTYIHVTLKGEQKHAGSTPMNARHDVVPAAADIILQLEHLARAYGNTHTVATVGKIQVFPNASNVIAGEIRFTIDIRDISEETKQELTTNICNYIQVVAKLRHLDAKYSVDTDDLPQMSDPNVLHVLEDTCQSLQIPYHKMTSGAYHDSLLVAEFAPMAMIFVPSKDGISHDPAEYTSIEEIACGVDVLANALLRLANMQSLN